MKYAIYKEVSQDSKELGRIDGSVLYDSIEKAETRINQIVFNFLGIPNKDNIVLSFPLFKKQYKIVEITERVVKTF